MCFELCGTGHYAMKGNVVIESEADFQKWLGEQTTFEEAMASVSGQGHPKQVSSVKVLGSDVSVSTQ
jgi:cytochrome c oxidase subunit 2